MGRKKLIRLLNQLANEMTYVEQQEELTKDAREEIQLLKNELAVLRQETRGVSNVQFNAVIEAGYTFLVLFLSDGSTRVNVKRGGDDAYVRYFGAKKSDMAMELAVETVYAGLPKPAEDSP